MAYQTINPPPDLSGFVRFFWTLESEGPYVHRAMADGCAELVFHYRGLFDEIRKDGSCEPSFLSGIQGQSASYRTFITSDPKSDSFGIFGAYLYPFAARELLRLPAFDLTDRMPDLFSALGCAGRELEDRMLSAENNITRYHILSRFLRDRLIGIATDQHPARNAVRYIIHSAGKEKSGTRYPSVRELARRFHMSERQFERKFREYSGLSPKRYLRIIRFHEACNQFWGKDGHPLSAIAHTCGYYDQSHFIRDFKRFSGYHPGNYFSGNVEGVGWRDEGE